MASQNADDAPVDRPVDADDLRERLRVGDVTRVNDLLWGDHSGLTGLPVDLLNELLMADGHHHHQRVAFALQHVGNAATVDCVRARLSAGFDDLAYTCSEDGAIAKWLSWTLAGIGTPAAIDVLREYSSSENPEVAEAMQYRLRRLANGHDTAARRNDAKEPTDPRSKVGVRTWRLRWPRRRGQPSAHTPDGGSAIERAVATNTEGSEGGQSPRRPSSVIPPPWRDRELLRGFEFDFVVQDQDGSLAVVSSAGYGPIPYAALARQRAETEFVDSIPGLPSATEAAWIEDVPISTWLVERVTRGFYCFDWRTYDGPFQLAAKPLAPTTQALTPLPYTPISLPLRFAELTSFDLAGTDIDFAP